MVSSLVGMGIGIGLDFSSRWAEVLVTNLVLMIRHESSIDNDLDSDSEGSRVHMLVVNPTLTCRIADAVRLRFISSKVLRVGMIPSE